MEAAGEQSPEIGIVDGLVQLSFVIYGTLERRATEHEISMIQARLLGVLRDRTPTMKELGSLLQLDKSSISGLVDRAERRGLVERLPSNEDRRVVLVTLTRTGRSLVTRVAAEVADDVGSILSYVSASDRDALSEIISRLLVANAAAAGIELLHSQAVSGI